MDFQVQNIEKLNFKFGRKEDSMLYYFLYFGQYKLYTII